MAIESCINELSQRLCNCWEKWESLKTKEDQEISLYLGHYTHFSNPSKSNGAVIPSIPDIRSRAESFLYDAKDFIRELIQTMKFFYPSMPTEINEASSFYRTKRKGDISLVEWMRSELSNDKLANWLEANREWILMVIDMRNAVEHPGGYAGTLEINNFQRQQDGKISVPTWELKTQSKEKDKPPTSITDDMGEICHGLLVFAEELIIHGGIINRMDLKFFNVFTLYEIPIAHRQPECPIRFKFVPIGLPE